MIEISDRLRKLDSPTSFQFSIRDSEHYWIAKATITENVKRLYVLYKVL